jgi:NAD(P)-dependent dehydrogenase (short-subunit alcohol dehydrogenase family)
MKALEDQVAIITGGASGIGKTISMAFAEAGATVVIPDLDAEGAEATSREIKSLGQKSFSIESDVANPDHVDLIFDKTLDAYGKIDILVNNAGTTHPTVSILDLGLEYVDKIFAVDFKGVYLCCRRAGREMIDQKKGCILNISSIAGLTPLPLIMYGPMKSAVNMLTRILAREWAEYNVRVNAIAPGYVLTPLIKKMIENGQRNPNLIIEQTPMKKMLDPIDVAKAALFLVSPEARYITGTVVPVDGGWLSDGGWAAYKQ